MKVQVKTRLLLLFIIAICVCILAIAAIPTKPASATEAEPYVTVESDFKFWGNSKIQGLNDSVYSLYANIKLEIPATINGHNVIEIDGSAFLNKNQITSVDFSKAVNLTKIGMFSFKASGISGDLILPEKVVEVGKDAFHSCINLTSVTFGSEVTTIADSAFNGCVGLSGDLVLPSKLQTIGGNTFLNCKGLNGNLSIPDSVKSIGTGAFSGCSGFDGTLKLPNNQYFTVINAATFHSAINLSGNLVIPEGVEKINDNAFYNCASFSGGLTLPNSVKSVGSSTFNGCVGFDGRLILSESLSTIGASAFLNCGFTGDLTLTDSIESIDANAFNGCTGFSGNLKLPTNAAFTTIENKMFDGGTNFTGDLIIPGNIKTIKDNAFSNGKFLGTLTLSSGIVTIGSSAFLNCSFVGGLTIPNTVTSIGASAFRGCSGFDGSLQLSEHAAFTTLENNLFDGCVNFTGDLIIPNNITTIKDSVFPNIRFGGTLTLSESLETIGKTVFSNCGFTGGLTIPNSVKSIGGSAFSNCKGFNGNLKLSENLLFTTIEERTFFACSFTGDLTIPNNITTIGNNAFSGVVFGGALKLSENLTTIGTSAFNACSGLVGNITMPQKLVNLGVGAFALCTGLDGSVTFSSNLVTIPNNLFNGCTKLSGNLVIPATVEAIGDNAFNNNSSLNKLTFVANSTLGTIGANAFSGCYGLSGMIAIPDNVMEIKSNAFAGCEKVNTFWLKPDVIYGNNIFSIFGGRVVNAYLMCDGAAAYDTLKSKLTGYEDKITYEIIVSFEGSGIRQAKLYQQPLSLVLSEDTGLWSSDPNYSLPKAAMQNKTHIGWSFTENGDVIGAGTVVSADKLYPQYEFLSMLADYTVGAGYTINGFSAEYLAGLDNPDNINFVIPTVWNDGVNGDAAVIGIASNAFKNMTQIKGVVTLTEGIQSIGDFAFKGCVGITDFYLPQSLANVGEGVFDETAAFIFAPSKAAYEALIKNANISKYAKLTYEMVVQFYNGENLISTQTKAFNQDIRLVKDTSTMHWSLYLEYQLPSVEVPDGYKWAGWISTRDGQDSTYLAVDGASNSSLATSGIYHVKLFTNPIDLSWLLILIGGLNIILLILLTLIFIMIYIKGVKYKAKKSKRLMSVVPFVGTIIVPPTVIASQVAIIASLGGLLLLEIGALVFLLLKMRSDRRKRLSSDLGDEDIDTSAVMIEKI